MSAKRRVFIVVVSVVLAGAIAFLFDRMWKLSESQREMREDQRLLSHRVEVVKDIQHIQVATKRFSVGAVPRGIQFWTEQWENGVKVKGEPPPWERHNGPFTLPAETIAFASALERPEGSGKIELVVEFPDAGVKQWMSVQLPPSGAGYGGTWQLNSLEGDISLSGNEAVELFVVARNPGGIVHGAGARRTEFADPNGMKHPTIVFKMRFVAFDTPRAQEGAAVSK